MTSHFSPPNQLVGLLVNHCIDFHILRRSIIIYIVPNRRFFFSPGFARLLLKNQVGQLSVTATIAQYDISYTTRWITPYVSFNSTKNMAASVPVTERLETTSNMPNDLTVFSRDLANIQTSHRLPLSLNQTMH